MKIFKRIAFAIYILHFLVTTSLILFVSGNIFFFVIYLLFVSIIYISFKSNISRPFSPNFIMPFWFFISYILPLPYLVMGYDGPMTFNTGIQYNNPHILSGALFVAMFGLLGAVAGNGIKLEPFHYLIRKSYEVRFPKLNPFNLILITLWFLGSFAIRYNLRLGVAGEKPIVPFAGIFQYFLYDGTMILFSYIFIKGLKQRGVYLVYAILLGMILVVTQALLGWRGTIIKLLNLILVITWFVLHRNITLKFPKKYFVMILMVIPLMMQIGDSVRNKDAEETVDNFETSNSKLDFFEKVIMRGQGMTRLITVTENSENFDPITNNFFFIDLFTKGISSTNFIDFELYGIQPDQSNSIGGGGVGNVYLSWGIIGTFLSYLLLAILFNKIYYTLVLSKNQDFLIVIYSQMVIWLPYYISENFDMSLFKTLSVIFVLSYIIGKLFTIRNKSNYI